MEIKTNSPHSTQKVGKKLGQSLEGPQLIALYGNLGSGKTTFIQGLAQGLGIEKRILSPTFVFVRSYPILLDRQDLFFYHIDLYRAQFERDYQHLGLDELFLGNSIVAIEWAEKIKKILPKARIDISIKSLSENERFIKIKRHL